MKYSKSDSGVMRKMHLIPLFLLCLFFGWTKLFSSADVKDNLVEQLIKSTQKRESSIKSIRAEIKGSVSRNEQKIRMYIQEHAGGKIGELAPVSSPNRYIWWMKGEKMRVDKVYDPNQDKTKRLAIFDGNKTYTFLYSPEDKTKLGQVHIYEKLNPALDEFDLVSLDYPLVIFGLNLEGKPLSQQLKEGRVSYVGKERIKGIDHYVFEFSLERKVKMESGEKFIERHKRRIWVDPVRGFAVLKIEEYSPFDNQLSYLLEMGEFKNYGEDIWLPSKAVGTLFLPLSEKKREPALVRILEITDMKVNEEIDDEVFNPNLPKGTYVYEVHTGRFYQVGKEVRDEDILERAKVVKKFLTGELKASDIEKQFPPKEGMRFDYNCGPNALLFVCGVFDIPATSAELARLASADEKGITSLAGLKKAAEAKGLKAEGMDLSIEELQKEMKKGRFAIAYLSFGHFIVIAGFEEDKAIVLDPPTILVSAPIGALDQIWDGRVLLISKP